MRRMRVKKAGYRENENESEAGDRENESEAGRG